MSYAPFPLVWGFFGSGGGGGGGPSFGVIQTDFGTYPTASGSSDVLTLISADSTKYYFTGTALTDTVTLTVNGLIPSGGSLGQVLTKNSATDYDVSWVTTTSASVALLTEVYNESGATIPKMSVVYLDGPHGNLPKVVLSQADSELHSALTYGVVQNDITNMNNGYVVEQGRLENLNTNVSGWAEGDILYLSPTVAGGITNVKPTAPNNLVFVGVLVRKHPTQGVIQVKIQNGYELDELHNVLITSPSNGQLLQYDSSTSLWKNATVSGTGSVVDVSVVSANGFAGTVATSTTTPAITLSTTITGLLKGNGTAISAASAGTDYQAPITQGNLTEATSSVLTITGGTNAIIGSGTTIQVKQASGSQSGYLSSSDWSVFNGKQNTITGAATTILTSDLTANRVLVSDGSGKVAVSSVTSTTLGYLDATSSIQTQLNGKEPTLTKGNLTESTSSVLTITGGSNAVIGSGTSIQVKQASSSTDGYVSSTQFNSFVKSDGSVAFAADQSMGSHKLTNVTNPSNAQDAATKAYVDNLFAGLDWKQAVHAATIANINLASAPASVDSHTLNSGERVLVKDQSTQSENGIYQFNGTGSAMTRTTDADTWDEIVGSVMYVEQGSTNQGSKWNNTNISGGTLGVTNITFTTFSSSGSVSGSGTTGYVAYWNGTSILSSEQYLSTDRGGLGTTATAFTGLLKFSSGVASAASLVDADVSASAAISFSKLAALTASRVLVSDGSGVVTPSSVTSTTLGYLDATSSVQTQLNGKVSKSGDSMTGSLGIGVTNRISQLQVSSVDKTVSSTLYTSDYITLSAEATAPGFNIITSSDTAGHRGVFKSTRSRNTLDVPTAVQSGDQILSIVGAGHDGTTNITTAGISFLVDGTVSTSAVPQAITFATGEGATRTERMRITSSGKVGINTVPSAGSATFSVKTTAIPSTAEPIAIFSVSDSTSNLNISNGSTVDGVCVPSLSHTQANGNNNSASLYQGYIYNTDDTGTNPVHVFRAQTQTTLGAIAAVVTRPLYQFRNWTTNLITVLANGKVGFGTDTPSEVVDVVGNIKASGTVTGSNLAGNLTEATSSVLTITGGTGSVIGSGTSIQVKQANTTQAGYISSDDWNLFDRKLSGFEMEYSVRVTMGSATLSGINGMTSNTSGTHALAGFNGATNIGKIPHVTINAVSTTGSTCGFRTGTTYFCVGGGFKISTIFQVSDATTVANARHFFGANTVSTATALNGTTNNNPYVTSLTNFFAFGSDAGAGDTNFCIYHNGNTAGSTTRISLGASFPNTNTGEIYQVEFYNPPASLDIYYSVTALVANVTTMGKITGTTSNLPTTTQLYVHNERFNAGTGSVVKFEAGSMFIYAFG